MQLKIADFGEADVVNGGFDGKPAVNVTGKIGSYPYMSPEQFLNDRPYDAKKHDIWAAAVIWYAMRFGSLPWLVPLRRESAHYDYFVRNEVDNARKMSTLTPHQSELMLSMLHLDPLQRISAKGILSHPGFKEISAAC